MINETTTTPNTKNIKKKIYLLASTLLMLLALVISCMCYRAPEKAEAATAVNTGYRFFIYNSEGTLLPATVLAYGKDGDYTSGEDFGRPYWFTDGAGGYVYQSFGRGTVVNLTSSVYEGDTITIQFSSYSTAYPSFNQLYVTYDYDGTGSAKILPTIKNVGHRVQYTIPALAGKNVTITARDTSTYHTVNAACGGNYLYICNFNIAKRTSTINSYGTIDNYVSLAVTGQTYTYTGKTINPFSSLSYVDVVSGTTSATNVGTYSVTLKPKMSYKWANGTYGNRTFNWTISAADISSATAVSTPSSYTYTGSEIKPTPPRLTYSGSYLTTADYDVSYKNNTAAGTASIVYTGKGNFSGTKEIDFTISPKSLADVSITPAVTEYTYNGSKREPSVEVKSGDNTLTTSDYSVVYSNNTDAGTATILVVGKGNYTGYASTTFTINKKSIDSSDITASSVSAVTYTGSAHTPTPTLTYNNAALSSTDDYTISYQNNTAAGTASVVFTGKGNFTGSRTVTFEIKKADQSFAYNDISVAAFGSVAASLKSGTTSTATTSFEISNSSVTYNTTDKKFYAGSTTARVGKFTVTAKNAGDNNYNSHTTTFSITVTLTNGVYVGDISGDNTVNTVYPTLEAALSAASTTTATTIKIKGEVSLNKTLALASGKRITITGHDSSAKLVRDTTSSFSGSLLSVGSGATLNINNLIVDGKKKSGNLITVSGGTLTVSGGTLTGGNATNGGAVYVDSGSLTISGGTITANHATYGGAVYVKSGTVTISGGTISSNDATNGGAVYADGGTISLSGGTLSTNSATNGGAVYMNRGTLSLTGSTLASNSATNGGGIYLSDNNVTANISGGTMTNNRASGFGHGLYTGATDITFDGGNSTANITDSLGLAGEGKIIVSSATLTHKVNVEFANTKTSTEDANTQLGKTFVSAKNISGADLKANFRVSNPGYTFYPNDTTPGELTLGASQAIVAVVKDSNGTEKTYTDIQAAIDDIASGAIAGPTVYLVTNTREGDAAATVNEILLSKTLTIPSGANIVLSSVEREAYYTDEAHLNMDYRYNYTGVSTTLKRSNGLTAEMILVEENGTLKIENVVLDGGAIWKNGVPEVTDDGKGGAGTAITGNMTEAGGITAHAPVIVNRGTITMHDGAVICNNDNNYATPGLGFGSQNYGGGVRNEANGNFTMNGGTISGCYSREGGAIMNVNKFGTPGTSPTVSIMGGTIENNASQMKGAAIQTIYGGAVTRIDGGTIENNISLNDLGVVSVEEGGTVFIAGNASISATSAQANAVFLYNRYSAEDYAGAATKPHIEGTAVGKLIFEGAPTIVGKVHIDNPCTVYGTDTRFEPKVGIDPNYTGSKLNLSLIDSKCATQQERAYGSFVYSVGACAGTADEFADKFTFTMPPNASDYDYSDRYTFISDEEKMYTFGYGGYDLTATQTEPGKIVITGQCDPSIEKISITVGGKTIALTTNNGAIGETITLSGGTTFDWRVTSEYANCAQPITKDFTDGKALFVIGLDHHNGEISAPSGTTYYNGTEFVPLHSGTIPNDLQISDGKARFVVNGVERTIAVGTRAADVTLSEVKSDLLDFTNTTITIDGTLGYEYNLVDDSGTLVSDWTAQSSGKVSFINLDPTTKYTVVVRVAASPDSETALPGRYIAIDGSSVTTLDGDMASKKLAFETAYSAIESKLLDDEKNFTATSAEIEAVVAAYELLTPNVVLVDLPKIKAAKTLLDETYHYTRAKEWQEAHSTAISDDEVSQGDETAVNAALDDYARLPDGVAKELVDADYDKLITDKKTITALTIDAALSEKYSGEAYDEIAAEYKDKIEKVDSDENAKANIELLLAQANAALALRAEYDQILADNGETIPEEYITLLAESLVGGLELIASTTADTLDSTSNSAILDLRSLEAKGLIKAHYDGIASSEEANGIVTPEGIAAVDAALAAALKNVDDNAQSKSALIVATADGKLALDRAEGKAIVSDYAALRADNDPDINAVVSRYHGLINDITDNAAEGGVTPISSRVEAAKLDIEKELAKDYVQTAASEWQTTEGDSISSEATATSGAIMSTDAIQDAWLAAEKAAANIHLEYARVTLAEYGVESVTTAAEGILNQAAADIAASDSRESVVTIKDSAIASAWKTLLDSVVDSLMGDDLSAAAQQLVADLKREIDAHPFADYPLLIEKSEAKVAILDRCEQLAEKANQNGFTNIGALDEALNKAHVDISAATESEGVDAAERVGLLDLERAYGTIDLENFMSETDSAAVKEIFEAAKQSVSSAAIDEVSAIVAAAKNEIEAQRFLDGFESLTKPFGDVNAADKEEIAKATADFTSLGQDVKAVLDSRAQEKGYADSEDLLADRAAKSSFEEKRDEVINNVNKLVREHDGERVHEIREKNLDGITDMEYEPQSADSRAEYLENLGGTLEEKRATADREIAHSQQQQRTENQLILDATERTESGFYNESQQQQIASIIESAQADINAVLVGTNAEEVAESRAALKQILDETKYALAEVPVQAVATEHTEPESPPTDETSIWGIVSNDASMPGSIKLVIERVSQDKMSVIKSAVKNNKVTAAEGNDLNPDQLKDLLNGKELKSTLDIYLMKDEVRITEFNGKYIVKVLLTESLRSSVGLQVVYVSDDGSVEVYDTVVEDGKYLVFVTAHFSEFYILGEPEVNLWWLIITLVIILLVETLIITKLSKRKQSADKAHAFLPLLSAVIIPQTGVIVCIVLGGLVIAAGVVITLLLMREKRAESTALASTLPTTTDEPKAAATIISLPTEERFPYSHERTPYTTTTKPTTTKTTTTKSTPKPNTITTTKTNTTAKPTTKPQTASKKSVSAHEAGALMSDATAKSMMRDGSRIADRRHACIINIDIIGRYFAAGETVTIERIRERVAGYKKATYIKVLARGTLDKPLTVEADDFSIDAVKMILLTGGNVVRTSTRR